MENKEKEGDSKDIKNMIPSEILESIKTLPQDILSVYWNLI